MSSHYTGLTAGTKQTQGHHATSGGLRGHSTGDLYPVGVQARVIGGQVYWQAWNLETGEQSGRLYPCCAHAHEWARRWKDGAQDALVDPALQ